MDTIFDYDVFISFASADEEIVLPIWQQLNSNGLRVFWSDESLKENAGKPFFSVIQEALSKSKHLLLVCTEKSMNSKWVKLEYETFYGQFFIQNQSLRRLLVYPHVDFDIKQLPPFLRSIQVSKTIQELLLILGATDLQTLKAKIGEVETELGEYKLKYEKSHSLLGGLSSQLETKTKDFDSLKIQNYELKQQIFDLEGHLKLSEKNLKGKELLLKNSKQSIRSDSNTAPKVTKLKKQVASEKQITTKELDENSIVSEEILRSYINNRGYYHLEWNTKGKYYKNDFVRRNNNSIVFDKNSNLTWQSSGSKSTMTFKNIQEYIDSVNKEKVGGASNWRLPTIYELYTLLEDGHYRRVSYEFDVKQNWIWSSSFESSSRIWVIGFHNGACNHYRTVGSNFVRLVHGEFQKKALEL